MSSSASTSAARPAAKPRRFVFPVVIAVLALGLFAGLVSYMRALESRAELGVADPLSPGASGNLLQTVRVAESVRALKLVTVQITTRVTAESSDSSWRGEASAVVGAPVRLHYGTDLSQLTNGSISFSPLLNSCVVRVPAPERIATEVIGNQEESEVHVGWLRFRAQAGQKHLGQARLDLYSQAQELRLLPADAHQVREQTREQVATLLKSIVGNETSVRVVFDDESAALNWPGAATADGPAGVGP